MIKDYSKQPILITGAARSGTSMTAGIVHICGAWKGDTRGPNKYNAKGMFENASLVNNLVKPYLKKCGCDPLGQYPLPVTSKLQIPMSFGNNVLNIIGSQGWTSDTKWMWKCVKMTLMWPVGAFHFPNAKWIIVRRKTPDIINSCLKTGFMRAFARENIRRQIRVKTEKEGWLWWVRQHEEKWIEMIREGLNVKQVWPERLINSDYSQMKEAIEWLGLEWREKEVIDFIEPKLWKARKK